MPTPPGDLSAVMRASAAILYALAFAALGAVSSFYAPYKGVCSDFIGFRSLHASSSYGASLPIPVVQMCSGIVLPALLIAGCIVASLAWIALRKYLPSTWVLVTCIGVALLAALWFPYIATTDPYAYALYGYEAKAGLGPYSSKDNCTSAGCHEPLSTLYRLFPSGSSQRSANYGPLAIAEYQLIATVAGNSLRNFLLYMRLLNALLLLTIAWACLHIRRESSGVTAAFTVFHPLMMLESVSFLHGDVLMLSLLCGAAVAYSKRSIAMCALLIVLAAEVRAVAGLAMIVLLIRMFDERDLRATVTAILTASAATLLTGLASLRTYGTFTAGASPAVDSFSSPMVLLTDAFGLTPSHLALGARFQALVGLGLLIVALRCRRYALVPLASLTMLPMARSWYYQWLVPQIALEPDSTVSAVLITAITVGIVAEWPEMTGHSDITTWGCILLLQWAPPLLIWVVRSYSNKQQTVCVLR